MKLRVKVAAGASGDGIVGWMGNTLKLVEIADTDRLSVLERLNRILPKE